MNAYQVSLHVILAEIVGSGLTLYMMAILLRWTAPWIELDMHSRYLKIIPRLVDPLIGTMRRLLPPMGPMDWAPAAALAAVWIARIILVDGARPLVG